MQAAVGWQLEAFDFSGCGDDKYLSVSFEKFKTCRRVRRREEKRFEGQPMHGAECAMTGNGKPQRVEFFTPLGCALHLTWRFRSA